MGPDRRKVLLPPGRERSRILMECPEDARRQGIRGGKCQRPRSSIVIHFNISDKLYVKVNEGSKQAFGLGRSGGGGKMAFRGPTYQRKSNGTLTRCIWGPPLRDYLARRRKSKEERLTSFSIWRTEEGGNGPAKGDKRVGKKGKFFTTRSRGTWKGVFTKTGGRCLCVLLRKTFR